MIWLVVAVAVVAAGGVWLVVSTIWPAPRSLPVAVSRLHTSVRPRSAFVPLDPEDHGWSVSMGRWLVRRLKVSVLADEQTASDLELVQRPLEVHAGTSALAAITGAFAGPLLWAVASSTGTTLPFGLPLWTSVVGAVVGWFTPRVVLRGEAVQARSDFRHALGAYLDVLVLLLAAQEGPEGAMDQAAQAGQGPAFRELRRAVWEARLKGEAVWATLDELGRRLRIPELREIAAGGSLAGESGAAVRKSLMAKARAMRQRALAEMEAEARRNSQAMFAPLALMGLGFILFLIYPLLSNLSFGG